MSSLRDDSDKFAELEAEIIGLNPASESAHANYINKFGFDFRILSDAGRSAAENYCALKPNGKSIQRTVYIIDKKGMIRFAEQGMPKDDKLLEAISGF